MYQIGDKVIYGVHGVCIIADQEKRLVDRRNLTYLALEPVGQEGSRYFVPTHNEAAMRKIRDVLTREELETLIRSEQVHTDCWVRDENQRKQLYRELIGSADRSGLMRMVSTLYRHKASQNAAGRKCHLCDENFLKEAERLLVGEIAMVMDLGPDEAIQYIRDNLKEDA